MSDLSDYKRCVSEPLERELRATIATLTADRDHYKALAERMDKALEEIIRIAHSWPVPVLDRMARIKQAAASARTMENPNG